jgi:hypothetical protein
VLEYGLDMLEYVQDLQKRNNSNSKLSLFMCKVSDAIFLIVKGPRALTL